MYGDSCYGEVPYAAFGSVVLFVAACIHIDNRLVYTATIDARVPPLSGSATVC